MEDILLLPTAAGDLPGIVDRARLCQSPSGLGRNPAVQVDHLALLPKEGVKDEMAHAGRSHHLSLIINAPGAAWVFGKSSQVNHFPVRPKEAMVAIGGLRETGDLIVVVNRSRIA